MPVTGHSGSDWSRGLRAGSLVPYYGVAGRPSGEFGGDENTTGGSPEISRLSSAASKSDSVKGPVRVTESGPSPTDGVGSARTRSRHRQCGPASSDCRRAQATRRAGSRAGDHRIRPWHWQAGSGCRSHGPGARAGPGPAPGVSDGGVPDSTGPGSRAAVPPRSLGVLQPRGLAKPLGSRRHSSITVWQCRCGRAASGQKFDCTGQKKVKI
eukprot:764861-Hanusia_phi.AAC.6